MCRICEPCGSVLLICKESTEYFYSVCVACKVTRKHSASSKRRLPSTLVTREDWVLLFVDLRLTFRRSRNVLREALRRVSIICTQQNCVSGGVRPVPYQLFLSTQTHQLLEDAIIERPLFLPTEVQLLVTNFQAFPMCVPFLLTILIQLANPVRQSVLILLCQRLTAFLCRPCDTLRWPHRQC